MSGPAAQNSTTRIGRAVKSSRKRAENDGIANEAVSRRKEKGKAREARMSQKKAKAGQSRPGLESYGY